jgi:DNA-binding CsgD family transcriptional regulator
VGPLTRHDAATLQAWVSDLYALRGLRDFRDWIVRALPGIVPGDLVAYTEVDLASRRISWNPEVDAALGLADSRRISARHMRDLPIFKSYRRGDGSAVIISDVLSQREFHRSAVYHEFFRPAALDNMIARGLPGPAQLVTAICVLRRGRQFSERDRLVRNLAQPHLTQACRNAHLFDAMKAEAAALRAGVEALDRGLVILDREHRVVLVTPRARRWMEAYFARFSGTDLPDALGRWVRHADPGGSGHGDPGSAGTSLTVDGAAGQLMVRLTVSDDEHRVLTLTERPAVPRPDALKPLGLSPREAEVLAWVTEGKTNAEIGTILGASGRTIDKHLERVLRKLDVATRTAAVARALLLLQA